MLDYSFRQGRHIHSARFVILRRSRSRARHRRGKPGPLADRHRAVVRTPQREHARRSADVVHEQVHLRAVAARHRHSASGGRSQSRHGPRSNVDPAIDDTAVSDIRGQRVVHRRCEGACAPAWLWSGRLSILGVFSRPMGTRRACAATRSQRDWVRVRDPGFLAFVIAFARVSSGQAAIAPFTAASICGLVAPSRARTARPCMNVV